MDCSAGPPFDFGLDTCGGAYGDGGGEIHWLQTFVGLCETPQRFAFSTANCGPDRVAYLNILIDFNHDGDWNDNLTCAYPGLPPPYLCVAEWAVKNHAIDVPNYISNQMTPYFLLGPYEGYAWMRVSLTDIPVADDFPWAGSANQPGGYYAGGETEDYLILLENPTPVSARPATWGQLKTRYW